MDIERLKAAFIKADDAGEVEDAKAFAAAIRKYEAMAASEQEPEKFVDKRGGIPAFRAFIDQGIQSLTGGYADELMAKGDALLFGADENERLKLYRNQEQSNRENNPIASVLGDVGGALALGGGAAKAGLTLSGKAAGLLPRAGLMAGEGAAYGALYGSGNAVEGERGAGALGGAAFGAAAGGAIPVIGAGVRSGWNVAGKPIKDSIVSMFNPDGFAAKKVSERLTADGTSLPQIASRLDKNQNMSVADISGQNARDLLKTTVNLPGSAKDRVQTQLAMRQLGQGDRLKQSLSKTFANPEGYLSVRDDIAKEAKRLAAPLYEKAYANPVEFTDDFQKILSTPAGKSALSKGIEIAKNEGIEEIGEMLATRGADGKVTFKRIPDMRVWDYIKRGFDDVIEGQTDSITGKVTTAGRAVVGLKKRMLAQLDGANPDYAAARKVAADGFKIDDALEFGRKSEGFSAEAIRRKMASVSEAEKQAIRFGRAEAIRKKIDGAGWTHNKIMKVINSKEQMASLRAMFPDNALFNEFKRTAIQEARKQRTFDTVRGNSSTAKQLMDLQDAGQLNEVGGLVGSAAAGNFGNVITKATNMVMRIGGFTPEVADGIAKRLMATDPQQVRKIMQELINLQNSKISNANKAVLIENMIGRLGAQQAGALAAN